MANKAGRPSKKVTLTLDKFELRSLINNFSVGVEASAEHVASSCNTVEVVDLSNECLEQYSLDFLVLVKIRKAYAAHWPLAVGDHPQSQQIVTEFKEQMAEQLQILKNVKNGGSDAN